jgi:uncharacterized membrane protein
MGQLIPASGADSLAIVPFRKEPAVVRKRRTLVIAMVIAIVAGAATYAFTASNTLPASTSAGSGAAAISGYTVSGVAYNLNATTPTNIDSVSFTINPGTASTVKAQLASGGQWYQCTNTAGSVSCATTSPQATVTTASQLTVIAAN